MTNFIRQQQLEWAKLRALDPDAKGYVNHATQNLPWLTPSTRAAFDAADGGEFGRGSGRAKIHALHSSSALAVNVFDYWTTRDRTRLAAALNLGYPVEEIRFEQQFPTGVGSRSPNIDVVLYVANERALAIESKFCEPFSPRSKTIQDKYFPRRGKLWARAGLEGAQHAADALRSASRFKFVDAPQLLKHMLGLARTRLQWHLLLLWYVPPNYRQRMSNEAEDFRTLLRGDAARFSVMSYQALWHRLYPAVASADAEYAEYLNDRYFAARVVNS
ncbi:MAG: PGN_0703 family putative restriction endonuclease [Gemmatimonadota bacterium]